MLLTAINFASSKGKTRFIMVTMKSLSSNHERISFRDKIQPKKEILAFDPLVQKMAVYHEGKKVRTMRGAFTFKKDYNRPEFNKNGDLIDTKRKRMIPKLDKSEMNKSF